MYKNEVYKHYENMIDDIKDEEVKGKLLDMLEDIDTMLFELEADIDEEIEKQEADYLPSYKASDMIDEFNNMCRREQIWYV